MALTVNDSNVIYLTRGDTMVLNIEILVDGDPYTPEEGDTIRFALKHSKMNLDKTEFVDTNPVITKAVDMEEMTLTLLPTDTASLGFGQYVYDIELTKSDGTVDTFIANKAFYLTPEVH